MNRLTKGLLTGVVGMSLVGFGGTTYYGYTLVNEQYSNYEVQQIAQSTSQEERRDRQINADYDNDIAFATSEQLAEARQHYLDTIEENAIGAIYAPDIDMEQPILAGTADYNLFNGIATAGSEQILGDGLWVGLAHELQSGDSQLLERIDELQAGNRIYATDFEKVYVYEVYDVQTVHFTNTNALQRPNDGEDARMLLYRCIGGYNTEYRLFSLATHVDTLPVHEVDENILKGLGMEDVAFEQDIAEDGSFDEEPERQTLEVKSVNYERSPFDNFAIQTYKIANQHSLLLGIGTGVVIFFLFFILVIL